MAGSRKCEPGQAGTHARGGGRGSEVGGGIASTSGFPDRPEFLTHRRWAGRRLQAPGLGSESLVGRGRLSDGTAGCLLSTCGCRSQRANLSHISETKQNKTNPFPAAFLRIRSFIHCRAPTLCCKSVKDADESARELGGTQTFRKAGRVQGAHLWVTKHGN